MYLIQVTSSGQISGRSTQATLGNLASALSYTSGFCSKHLDRPQQGSLSFFVPKTPL